MNDLANRGRIEGLPQLIKRAAAALSNAATAAEVLEAGNMAKFAYDEAKLVSQFAKVKGAHDEIIATCRKTMADSLEIESRAQCRLADEYDAAQARGEVNKVGQPKKSIIPNKNNTSAEDIGLTLKQIHEARKVRDAEKTSPGVVTKTIEAQVYAGKEPTRAAVRRAINETIGKKPERPRKHDEAKAKYAASLVLDEGKTRDEAAAITGVQSVQLEVERERGRREVLNNPQIDPGALALNAQQRLEAAIRQHKNKLDIEFEGRVQAELERIINETVLPQYNKEMAEARDIVESRKGVLSREDYRLILSCLHPDRVTDEGLKKRYERAFDAFKKKELVLCSEKEMPTSASAIPRSYAEMMKRRAEMKMKRSAKSNGQMQHRV